MKFALEIMMDADRYPAFWVSKYDEAAIDYLYKQAVKDFRKLADTLGFDVVERLHVTGKEN